MILATEAVDKSCVKGLMYDALVIAYEVLAEAPTFSLSVVVAEALERIWNELELQVGKGRVERWLRDPATYSPHVDLIALDRALRFDWSAIERLSRLEWDVYRNELAGMEDPLGVRSLDRSRGQAWDLLTDEQQAFLLGAIDQRRRKPLRTERRALTLAA